MYFYHFLFFNFVNGEMNYYRKILFYISYPSIKEKDPQILLLLRYPLQFCF